MIMKFSAGGMSLPVSIFFAFSTNLQSGNIQEQWCVLLSFCSKMCIFFCTGEKLIFIIPVISFYLIAYKNRLLYHSNIFDFCKVDKAKIQSAK